MKSTGTTASEISKSMCCSCNINFTLMVKEHAEEMKVHSCSKQKEPLLDIRNCTQRAFYVPKQGNLNANGKKVLEYVLQEHKNGLPIT
jgi:hypothetical protein